MRLFAALAASVLLGALATGLYAVAEDGSSLGFVARLLSVAPKALRAGERAARGRRGGAALAGRRLARSVERLADAAARIAEGERGASLPSAGDRDARRITRALATLRREVESRPYAAAFLRDAWHDLKTPLAAIRASVEVLEDGALDDPEAARRFVGNLARSAAELDCMLGDSVTLARMETGTLAGALHRGRRPGHERRGPRRPPRDGARRGARGGHGPGPRAERALRSGGGRPRARQPPRERRRRHAGRRVSSPSAALRATGSSSTWSTSPPWSRASSAVALPAPTTSGKGKGSGLGLAIARAAVEAHGGSVHFVELGPPRVRVRVELPR